MLNLLCSDGLPSQHSLLDCSALGFIIRQTCVPNVMCGRVTDQDTGEQADVDAVVVGAGFSGLYMSYRLRELGLSYWWL